MSKEKLWYEKELRRLREDVGDLERYIEEFTSFIPVAVCGITPIGIIVNINRVFEELTGYQKGEIIGKSIEIIFFEKEKIEPIITEAFKKKIIKSKELILVSKEKKKIPVTISISARKDAEENIIGYFIGVINITEMKEFQKNLEEKVKERTMELESKTKELATSRIALMNILEDVGIAREMAEKERDKTLSIIESFPEGLLFFDKNNELFSINPMAQELFALSFKQLIGQKPKELMKVPCLAPLIKIFGEGLKRIFKEELKLKDGVILEVSTMVISSEKEKIGTLVILRDITREKFVEKLKTEFVSIAAHQLRTPLAAIKWTLRMLLDGDLGAIVKEQREFLDKTYQSNERMIHLINDLLNVTRIEEGRFLYDVKTQDIIEVAEIIIAPLKKVAQKKGIDFEFKRPIEKMPGVKIDSEKISFVFQNLIINAIQYSEPGKKIEVAVNYLKEKEEILISVKDQGIGIPKNQHERVFSRFFRSGNAIKMETDGTGLGLYIVKNIVQAHKGKIWFESEEGKGSTFYFTLPVK